MIFPSTEFDDAVAAACHGTAGEARLAELARLLAESDAALEAYIARVELHASLLTRRDCAVVSPLVEPRMPPTAAAIPARAWLSIAAVVAGIGIVCGLVGFPGGATPRVQPVVGTLADVSSVVWVRPDVEAAAGGPVRLGEQFELASGSLRIDFACGASVWLTGPAIFTVESPLAAMLTLGRARVMAATPEAKGFTIRTRTSRIVDLGTEFTAEALPDGRCRVGVSSGEVRIHFGDGRGSRDAGELLGAGDLLEVAPGRRQVITRIESGDDSAAFRFKSIEPPSPDDLADGSRGRASIRCVRGMLYENPAKQVTSAAPEIVLDGKGQSGPDAPTESLYFADGEEGGLVIDLGADVAVTKINVYSWHRCLDLGFPAAVREAHRERAAQHYAVYGRADDAGDASALGAPGQQPGAGWSLIARVNSDRHFGLVGSQRPAQQASSLTSARGPLGRFRYLMFVVEPITGMDHDGALHEFGTFCGEIDVYGE